jgi:hypothetical protein
VGNCPLCGAPLAYSGQPFCAACGADLRLGRGPLIPAAATTPAPEAAPTLAPVVPEAAPISPSTAVEQTLEAATIPAPEATPALTTEPVAEPVAEPVPASPVAEPVAVLASQGTWSASHWTSAFGQPAWINPDASVQPAVLLPANLELAVVQTQGPWAQVSAQNGWQGWVDAGQLVAMPWAAAGWSGASWAAAPGGGTSHRTKAIAIVVGVLVVAALVVASAADGSSPNSGLLWTDGGQTAPEAGHWTGANSNSSDISDQPGPQGDVRVEFTVVGNSATQVSVSFWDSHDTFYKWNCADADISDGAFAVSRCVSSDDGSELEGDVTGTFDESIWLDGEYNITVHGDTYSDSWTGMHF